MGAAAAARTAPAPRRAPARRTRQRPSQRPRARRTSAQRPRAAAAPALRPNPALAGAALIPHAAARTAGAIGDLSDSGLIMRLTRGRGWIALLCVLLGGIVTLNVLSLSYNATSGRVGQQIEELERQNSALRGELAETLSAGSVETAAANMGLAVPAPEDVTYLTAGDGDADRLAELLGAGSTFVNGAEEEVYETVEPVYEPAEPSYEPPPSSEPPSTPSEQPAPQQAAPQQAAPPSGGTTGGVGL
jgi:hypothetical protein